MTTTVERAIYVNSDAVRSILAGDKTQMRNIAPVEDFKVKSHGEMISWSLYFTTPVKGVLGTHSGGKLTEDQARQILASEFNPLGKPGDKLSVRERWQFHDWTEDGLPCIRYAADNATAWKDPDSEDWQERVNDIWASLSRAENFKIDGKASDRIWRPARQMPRWASRLRLEIVRVTLERLHDISEADAQAEGSLVSAALSEGSSDDDPRASFSEQWQIAHGANSWEVNPWVWVTEFKKLERKHVGA